MDQADTVAPMLGRRPVRPRYHKRARLSLGRSVGVMFRRLLAASLILAATTVDAFAYLDPGTGSMVLQLLLGCLAGLLVFGKIYLRRFADLFRRRRK